MSRLIYVPLENIPTRYSVMVNWMMCHVADAVVSPPAPVSSIDTGAFLNFNATCRYKARQLELIADMFGRGEFRSGDAFLFADILYPGLPMVRLLAEAQGLQIRIGAINHAGRADPTDMVNQFGTWMDATEKAWHEVCDVVFVGSNFHRQQVLTYLGDTVENQRKVVTTGQPFSHYWTYDCLYEARDYHPGEGYVVWAHRVCKEKGFDELIEIALEAPSLEFRILSGTDLNFSSCDLPSNVKPFPRLSKSEYLQQVSNARLWLATGHQETFGYSLHEALALGVRVVAPNRACYPEFLPIECLYNTLEQAIQLVLEPPPRTLISSERWMYLSQVPRYQRSFLCA